MKKLSENAILPARQSEGAAGYDLFAAVETVIPARGRAIVPTGIAVAVPAGFYGRVAPRSSLAVKSIDVSAGVIDADYRGPIGVVLVNNGDTAFTIASGDRCAQLILTKIATPIVVEVSDLDDTSRGAGGFGSTGV